MSTLDLFRYKDYLKALRYGWTETCIEIENTTGLLGYPPELVIVGLQALVADKNPHEAIDFYCKEAG